MTSFFEHVPVRKQTAIKSSGKWLIKIRRLMQAYALARPTVRLRLHVLKAKNDRGDFVYAPKANANIEDAVLKVMGADCALQCDWTALETDGFEIHAFLPKSTASGSQVANHGAFVSVDARPVSNSRGTIKQVVSTVKDKLRKSNPSFKLVKDPFFYMNIICPPDSYDLNIEPAKDDVMFESGNLIVGAVHKLLESYYPEVIVENEGTEPSTSVQVCKELQSEVLLDCEPPPSLTYEHTPKDLSEGYPSEAPDEQSRWRSSMYGIDEDDVEFNQENQSPVIEESEEGLRSVALSNPWTITKMNTIIKPKNTISNDELPSPAKNPSEACLDCRSPTQMSTPIRTVPVEPLTPQISSNGSIARSLLDRELESSIQHRTQILLEVHGNESGNVEISAPSEVERFDVFSAKEGHPTDKTRHAAELVTTMLLDSDQHSPLSMPGSRTLARSHERRPPMASAPLFNQWKQSAYSNTTVTSPTQKSSDTWFGQPMRGSESSTPSSRRPKRLKHQRAPFVMDCARPDLFAAERSKENRLLSENNADIRDFFDRSRIDQGENFTGFVSDVSRTPIHIQSQPSQIRGQANPATEFGGRPLSCNSTQGTLFGESSRATSAETQSRSIQDQDQVSHNSDPGTAAKPYGISAPTRACRTQEGRSRALSAGSTPSVLFNSKHDNIRDALQLYRTNGVRPGPEDMTGKYAYSVNSASRSQNPLYSSLGNIRPSLRLQQAEKAITLPNHHHSGGSHSNAKEIDSLFGVHEKQEFSSPIPPTRTGRGGERSVATLLDTARKAHCLRVRTTDGLERTRSAKLPLERVPHGHEIQDVLLLLNADIRSIIQISRKLDMRCNSLGWGHAVNDAFDIFADVITERTIMEWARKLDGILSDQYGRMGNVDTGCELLDGIEKGLHARKEDYHVMKTIEGIHFPSSAGDEGAPEIDNDEETPGVDNGIFDDPDELTGKIHANIPCINLQQRVHERPRKTGDETSDFDMPQSAGLDSYAPMSTMAGVDEKGDEYHNDIEDDMLMDL